MAQSSVHREMTQAKTRQTSGRYGGIVKKRLVLMPSHCSHHVGTPRSIPPRRAHDSARTCEIASGVISVMSSFGLWCHHVKYVNFTHVNTECQTTIWVMFNLWESATYRTGDQLAPRSRKTEQPTQQDSFWLLYFHPLLWSQHSRYTVQGSCS